MATTAWHHHPTTGLPCDCRYNRPKFLRGNVRVAGVNWNRALKTQLAGKKFQSIPGAQKFIDMMSDLMHEDENGWYDEIAPFLVKEFAQGRIRESGDRFVYDRRGMPTILRPWQIGEWGRWAAARQHPSRRGINITGPDLTVHNIHQQVDQFMEDMAERERRALAIEDMQASEAPVAYQFNDGWTIRDLAQAPNPSAEMELEGNVMDHCIGNDGEYPHEGYSYKDAVRDEIIPHVYSLRDPEGMPHTTFHFNPDGTLAEMHGYNNQDSALRKYAPRLAHFLREFHPGTMSYDADSYTADDMRQGRYPWEEYGNTWDKPNQFPESFDVAPASRLDELFQDIDREIGHGVDNYEEGSHRVGDDYHSAIDYGEAPSLNWQDPDYQAIVEDMVDRWDPSYPEDITNALDDLRSRGHRGRGHLMELMEALRQREPVRRYRERPNSGDVSWGQEDFGIQDGPYYDEDGTRELQDEVSRWYNEHQQQEKVEDEFPGAFADRPLFRTDLPRGWDHERAIHRFGPPVEDSYRYPVTDPDVLDEMGPAPYLNPTDKGRAQLQVFKNQLLALRSQGYSWDDLARRMNVYQRSNDHIEAYRDARESDLMNEIRNLRVNRDSVLRKHEQEVHNSGGDIYEPSSALPFDEMMNRIRQQRWLNHQVGGLSPDQASQRIIEWEREVRNNPRLCPLCHEIDGRHAYNCPNHPTNIPESWRQPGSQPTQPPDQMPSIPGQIGEPRPAGNPFQASWHDLFEDTDPEDALPWS